MTKISHFGVFATGEVAFEMFEILTVLLLFEIYHISDIVYIITLFPLFDFSIFTFKLCLSTSSRFCLSEPSTCL